MSYFVPSLAGIAAVGVSGGVVEYMGIAAEQISVLVRDGAPVLTGEYQASIHSESGIENGRGFGRAYSVDPKAIYLEVGTVDTPTFQPFGLALDRFNV